MGHVAAGASHDVLEVVALEAVERAVTGQLVRIGHVLHIGQGNDFARRRAGGRQHRLQAQLDVVGQQQRALHQVVEFAHIARPVVAVDPGQRARVQGPRRQPVLARVALDEVLRQQQRVTGSFAQGRHLDHEHAEPEGQVVAELTAGQQMAQARAGRGDHPHVAAALAGAADRAVAVVLQETQQCDLGA